MEPARYYTHSLRQPAQARILAAALQAVDPHAAVTRYLGQHPLPAAERIYALGVGKAALPMTQALAQHTPLARALVITKHLTTHQLAHTEVLVGDHPIPGAGSLAAGQAALDFVSQRSPADLLVCLISGGGSALMSAPRISLSELQALTASLLASGAPIDEINTLRRHLDRVKGGQLAQTTRARVLSLILSDVVGNPLETIASGPTAPDPSTRQDALGILGRYQLQSSARATIEATPETPKPGDPLFERVQNVIVGDNALAVQAALAQAQAEGYQTVNLGSQWQGEARQVGGQLARRLIEASQHARGAWCLVAGGETTVTLRGQGRGGRNQELALAAVPLLAGLDNAMLVTLATDGEDGPTDAAGAVVTGATLTRARALGLDPAQYLERNDSYTFFQHLDDLLLTSPTGTNVNDLTFLFWEG